ncbi:hypothetical protein [Streptomyces sp. NPDC058861]|uniref:hypothetical protein n=1 Tax=Streptomyces sp. NPDC058861 TaxID=3346653 RepID=UPI0036C44CAF
MSLVRVGCGVRAEFAWGVYDDAHRLAGQDADFSEPGDLHWCELPADHRGFSPQCCAFLGAAPNGGVWARWDREADPLVVEVVALPACPASSGDPDSAGTEACTLFGDHLCGHSWEFGQED